MKPKEPDNQTNEKDMPRQNEVEEIVTLKGHADSITCFAFSPDNSLLVSADSGGQLKRWEIPSGKIIEKTTRLKNKSARFDSLAFSPDGKLFSMGISDDNPRVSIFQVNPWQHIRTLGWDGIADSRTYATFSSDGKRLVVAVNRQPGVQLTWEGYIRSFDTDRWKEAKHGMWLSVDSVATSPDGKWIAAASRRHEMVLLDHKSGENFGGKIGAASAIAFSPDGRLLARANKNSFGLWDLTLQQASRSVDLGQAEPHSLAFTPDGKVLVVGTFRKKNDASGDYYREVSLWNVQQMKKVQCVVENDLYRGSLDSPPVCAIISPDGTFLAAVCNNSDIKLFKRKNWQP